MKTFFIIVGLALFLSCRNPFFPELGVERPDPPLANTTPAAVLENLKKAYNNLDYDLYASLLSPDFLFVVNQYYDDSLAAGSYDRLVPDSAGRQHKAWGRQKELDRHRKMFQEGGVGADAILLQFTVPDSTTWSRSGGDGWLVYVDKIRLDVTYGRLAYNIAAGEQQFYFQRQAGDTTLWCIAQWWDFDPEPPPE
jgi:hypothetical protein